MHVNTNNLLNDQLKKFNKENIEKIQDKIDATCEYLSALNLMSDAYKVNQNGATVVTDPNTGGAGKPVNLAGVFNVKMTGISNVQVQIGNHKFTLPYFNFFFRRTAEKCGHY